MNNGLQFSKHKFNQFAVKFGFRLIYIVPNPTSWWKIVLIIERLLIKTAESNSEPYLIPLNYRMGTYETWLVTMIKWPLLGGPSCGRLQHNLCLPQSPQNSPNSLSGLVDLVQR